MALPQIPVELKKRLWKHQISSIQFALEKLRRPGAPGTALLRMPTATGKTGVIGALSIAILPTQWTLVLTPWTNLCQQMIEDLSTRFWTSREWLPPTIPAVERLFPSTLTEILEKKDTNLVVVATFATLVTIYKKQRPQYTELSNRLSQVFVDEGHYEPAVEWGQAVKQLKKPTVLLTATPYRNDLKLFRVDKKDVQHYTHKEAEHDGIVRKVEFLEMEHAEPTYGKLATWCKEFVKFWKSSRRKALHKDARAIICCAKMETVKRVTELLRDENIEAIGVHEGFAGKNVKWLQKQTPDSRTASFEVWVHQNKLTEGLDDSRFCVLAILNRIRNDRKLIQQIGRVLRMDSKSNGKAVILYSKGLTVEKSWTNYRQFEVQPDFVDPERYRTLLQHVLKEQPEMEYFGGRFRKRFDSESQDLAEQILLNASSVVRRVRKSFVWDEFVAFASDFLLLEDCILLGPDAGPVNGEDGSKLWVYAMFGNAPLLIEHSHYEIRLGALAAVLHKDLLFVTDTEGQYPSLFLTEHTRKISPDELGRIFGKKTIPKEVSLTNPWPTGPTIRRSLIYADNLTDTPAQLTDGVLVCGGARATVLPEKSHELSRRRYVGFERGRVSEQLRSTERSAFSLREFVDWTRESAEFIVAEDRKPPEFFKRYLSTIAPPPSVDPKYLILNIFEGDVELENAAEHRIELVDSIVELSPAKGSPKGLSNFEFSLRYWETSGKDKPPKTADAVLSYEPASALFRIHSKELNTNIIAVEDSTEEAIGLARYLNNNDEAFAVALKEPDVFYTAQAFYRIDYSHAESRLANMLYARKDLAHSTSEKGKKGKQKTHWDNHTVFQVIDSRAPAALVPSEFPGVEFVFCDDLGTEVADFVCANFAKPRIAFIHAKYGKNHKVSASALHEAVSQAIKNLSVLSRTGAKPEHISRWNRDSKWPGTKIHRWRKGANSLPEKDTLWNRIRTEILDAPVGQREVWLVLGKTLEKASLLEQLKDPTKRTAVTGQVVHLLSSLLAHCTQVAVQLKVFCD
jgi:superfamily II DNA or RNA helicase